MLKVLKLKVIGSLRSVKSVKPNGNWKPSDLMKTTVVVESLSYYKTNVLFQRISAYFKIYSTVWEIYT